jgi:glycosyltransferase involved in cell wall biosynthesis
MPLNTIVFGLSKVAYMARDPLPSRLGVYQDGPFRLVRDAGATRLAADPADAPFFRFVSEVARPFDGFVVFARVTEVGIERAASLLPPETEVVRLPDYGSLRRLHSLAAAALRTCSSFWRGLDRVDVVWAFGPHPLELLLVTLARLRGKRVVLGVRQDTLGYFRARLPSPRWKPVLAAIRALDGVHRLVARRIPATVVGPVNAERYKGGRGRTLMMMPSLVRDAEVVAAPVARDWSGEIGLLTVGRIDAEKNPFLLLDALAEIERRRPGRFRLRWAGVGPLADAVRIRAAELGLAERVELLGYVPFGSKLLELYRQAHVFVHVSLTEGVPHVLHEALASGTPIVATDVGGVGAALEDGRAGLLVPPRDAETLIENVFRIADDEPLRAGLVERGLELARERTLEKEAARVGAFLRNA